MGVDHLFYLVSAEKYIKELRPKLIKYNGGPINFERALQEQKQRVNLLKVLNMLGKGQSLLNLYRNTDDKGPLSKHMKRQQIEQEEKYKLYDQIREFLKKETKQLQSIRNPFLRHETYLQEIDSFDNGLPAKVCNMIQVENFLSYMKTCRQIREKHPECEYGNDYDYIEEAEEIFNEVLKEMKESKEEIYLIYRKC